ncbi:hypothetical protein JW964_05345 [candidate division KSB1 bacterium]|nr:hypothetical protein [candidate division KSB1 bacterium]
MKKANKKVFVLTILILIGSLGSSLWAKVFHLETYITEPVASYDHLRLIPISTLSDCPLGTLYVDKDQSYQLLKCDGGIGQPFSSIWNRNSNIVFTTNTDNAWDLKLGIGTGTTEPEFKLTLINDGGILAEGEFGNENSARLLTAGEGTKFIWYPYKAAFRAGYVNNNQWDDSNIGNHSVAFGSNNLAVGEKSAILGGVGSQIGSSHSFIGGGRINSIRSCYCSSSEEIKLPPATGTCENISEPCGGDWQASCICPTNGTIVARPDDDACESITDSCPSGALWRDLSSFNSIVGGYGNVAGKNHSFVGSGEKNRVGGQFSSIGGGYEHYIHPNTIGATIVGGYGCEIDSGSHYSAIGGGVRAISWNYPNELDTQEIRANSPYSTIMGGQANVLTGEGSFIAGGKDNEIVNNHSTVLGGEIIFAPGPYQIGIIEGALNINAAYGSAISGGVNGWGAAAVRASALGKCSASVGKAWLSSGQAKGDYSVVFGKTGNIAYGDYSVIMGGENFTTTDAAHHSVIMGIPGINPNRIVLTPFGWLAGSTYLDDNQFYNLNLGMGCAAGTPVNQEGIALCVKKADTQDIAVLMEESNLIIREPYLDAHWANHESLLIDSDGKIGILGTLGGDIAEIFEANGPVEAGDVVSIDSSEKNKLKRASKAYDPKVIGIVSHSPAITLIGNKMILSGGKPYNFKKNNKIPVALTGRVLVKVCLENGPIEAGDFLTSSSTIGHAMKATNRHKSFGTIIGRALESFDYGSDKKKTGTITALIKKQ